MGERNRAVTGFLVAPLAPGVVMELARQFHLVVGGFEVAIYAYPISWLLGLPAFGLYQALGWNRLIQYMCGSFAVMFAFSMMMLHAMEESSEPDDYRGMMMYSALTGGLAVVAATTFWLIAIRRGATRRHAGE